MLSTALQVTASVQDGCDAFVLEPHEKKKLPLAACRPCAQNPQSHWLARQISPLKIIANSAVSRGILRVVPPLATFKSH